MRLQGLLRSRHARRWFGVFVVLAFGLKALLPTGYMFAAVDGHARLVMCPAGLYHAAGVHHMVGMEHALGTDHSAHAALAADQCPFALAGGAAVLAAVHDPAKPYFVVLPAARAVAVASVPIAPPPRHHAPRGPPSLA